MDYKLLKLASILLILFSFSEFAKGNDPKDRSDTSYIYRDDTDELQKMINNLSQNGILDGKNKTYYVTALWLKSNMTIANIKLVSIPTDVSDVSVLNIGNDIFSNKYNSSIEGRQHYEISKSYPGFSNITIINLDIDGSRAQQKNLELRDGGKHGINIKGFAQKITMRNVTIHDCATDGISIYRGLHTNLLGDKEIFAVKNVVLENVISKWNRRHGGSGDSIDGFLCIGSKFVENGKTLSSKAQNQKGLEGARYKGNLYGNGWDMEGYGLGSATKNISFVNSQFINNVGGGVVFYDVVDSNDIKFVQRENIILQGCTIDAGEKNPTGDYSLVFSSSIGTKKNKVKLYSKIKVINSILYGKLLLRSAENISLKSTRISSAEKFQGLLDNVSNLEYNFTAKGSSTFVWDQYDSFNIK